VRYEMLSNEFDYDDLKANSDLFAIKKYKDSSIYKGELYITDLKKKFRHGKGVIIYGNGRVYEGEWQRN
jgi:hypothetical protein